MNTPSEDELTAFDGAESQVARDNAERLLGVYAPPSPGPDFADTLRQRLRLAAAERQAAAPAVGPDRARPRWPQGLALIAVGALGVWAGRASAPEASPAASPRPHQVPAAGPRSAPVSPPALPSSASVQPTHEPELTEAAPPPEPAQPEPAQPEPVDPPSTEVESEGVAPVPSAAVEIGRGPLLTPQVVPAPALAVAAIGSTLETAPLERRRVRLVDGTELWIDADSRLTVRSDRRVDLERGEVLVDVAPSEASDPFVLGTPRGTATALATRFDARVSASEARFLVTHGEVTFSGWEGTPLTSGQWLAVPATGPPALGRSLRPVEELAWARELADPASALDEAGRPSLTVDGQALELRRVTVDVHVQDGFARTALDLTWFNASWTQAEGTLRLPLPPDAAISRLAMYVNGRLLEGAMLERERARDIYETIRHARRDPALLEWLDGSVFKLRVFPLEPRQEKRIVVTWLQRISPRDGRATYRFPGPLLTAGRSWAFRALLADQGSWRSPTHALAATSTRQGTLLTIDGSSATERDLVVELAAPTAPGCEVELSDEGLDRFLFLRWRPELPRSPDRPRTRRDWVILFEASADRDPALAGVQLELVRGLLSRATPGDTVQALQASTRTSALGDAQPATPANVDELLDALSRVRLIGALDLGAALSAARTRLESLPNPVLVHVGGAMAALGERDPARLAELLPARARYLGLAVGRRWSKTFMEAAAARCGGLAACVHPGEPARWRGSALADELAAPRLQGVRLTAGDVRLLPIDRAVAAGEELIAVGRLPRDAALPLRVDVAGLLDGQPFHAQLPVREPPPAPSLAGRLWARLRIEELVREGAVAERPREIVDLSTRWHVLSPLTSLLVLESEADYAQRGVRPGPPEPWAPYACPSEIPVQTEPQGRATGPELWTVLGTIVGLREWHLEGLPLAAEAERRDRFQRFGLDPGFERRIAVATPQRTRVGPGGFLVDRRELLVRPDQNGNVTQTLSEGRNAIFLRATRPLEEDDYFYRRNDAPAEDETLDALEAIEDRRQEAAQGRDFQGLRHEEPIQGFERFGFGQLQIDLPPASRERSPRSGSPVPLGFSPVPLGFSLFMLPHSLSQDDPRSLRAPVDLSDPLAFAPGLRPGRDDVEAVLNAETELGRPGRIDPAARELIARAGRDWQRVSAPTPSGDVTVEWSGESFRWQRMLPGGLLERVLCDAGWLHVVYPELAVGGSRVWACAYREWLEAWVPWATLPARELARGADVLCTGPDTVAVRPFNSARPVEELCFAESGRLSERRWRDRQGTLLQRATYSAAGEVVVFGGDGRELGRRSLRVEPCAPLTRAALRPGPELVMLPLPARNDWLTTDQRGEDLHRLAWNWVSEDPLGTRAFVQRHMLPRNRQLGLYAFLAGSAADELGARPDPRSDYPHAPLAAFLAAAWFRRSAVPAEAVNGVAPESFLGRLQALQCLAVRVRLLTPEQGGLTQLDELHLLARLAGLVAAAPPVGVLEVLGRLRAGPGDDPGLVRRAAALFDPLLDDPLCGQVARALQVQLLAAHPGTRTDARQRILAHYAHTLRQGLQLRVTQEQAELFGEADGSRAWVEWVDAQLPLLLAAGRQDLALDLADVSRAFEQPAAVGLAWATILESAQGEARASLILRRVVQLIGEDRTQEAEALLGPLLAEEPRDSLPWALAAQLADCRQDAPRALQLRERAVEIAILTARDGDDLDALRRLALDLLARYRRMANSLRELELPPPHDLVARVARAADLWRVVDPDPTEACQLAAQVLTALGEHELAWDYLVTPLATRQGEAGPWAELAIELLGDGQLERADQAWAEACAAEPTNASYLAQRAFLLERRGLRDAAQVLWRWLAFGTWQPRFASEQAHARARLRR